MKWTCLIIFFLSLTAKADYYGCYKMIYKDGWFKTYEHKGNTWGANTQKHGVLSSVAGSTTEGSTASLDPGVTTGQSSSSVQFSSSWGECSGVDILITKEMRNDYIEQNIVEIKKQIALGKGHHLASLAQVSGCKGTLSARWTSQLRFHMSDFYDANTGKAFGQMLDEVIQQDQILRMNCKVST